MDITFDAVGFTYQPGTPVAEEVLQEVSFTIKKGTFAAIIGHTGSGKSTLIQHINGLLRPTTGTVHVGDYKVLPEGKDGDYYELRKRVGMVFQFPESQLFEETIERDIAFGPKNFELEDIDGRIHRALEMVGLPQSLRTRSPFDLSGGQMRRVAIAGVLAIEPDILILDEPTAGLDPLSRVALLTLLKTLHQQGMTIILVTHWMEDVATYAEEVLVMEKGRLVKHTDPKTLFSDQDFVKQHQLDVPPVVSYAKRLQDLGFSFSTLPITEEQLVAAILPQLRPLSKEELI